MKIYQVDAFTNEIFKGNVAGVCILENAADEQWMQNVAMEMNLSETAFLYKQNDVFNLRWFTPEAEVDLCGHATLASAHVLWETGVLDSQYEAVFSTKSGILKARKEGETVLLDFPAEIESNTELPQDLKVSLGVPILYVGRNRMDYIVEVENEEVVRKIKPNFERMKKIETRGIIVTSRSDSGEYDFVSRFFAPRYGINEDPVTGSAHCCLGPYWKKRLGKDELKAFQASKRGGWLKISVPEDGDRVYIAGRAVTVFCAEFKGV